MRLRSSHDAVPNQRVAQRTVELHMSFLPRGFRGELGDLSLRKVCLLLNHIEVRRKSRTKLLHFSGQELLLQSPADRRCLRGLFGCCYTDEGIADLGGYLGP